MARTYSIDDPNTQEILRKWQAGEKLTKEELNVIGGLARMYPQIKSLRGQSANVNVSNVQTNPYISRSRMNQSNSSGAGRRTLSDPVSPGGRKFSGRDAESLSRRSGGLTPDSVGSAIYLGKDGNLHLGNHTFTQDQVQAIERRGMSGATLNWKDQAIYDASVRARKQMRDQELQRQEDERIRREKMKQLGLDPKKFKDGDEALDKLYNQHLSKVEQEKAIREALLKNEMWQRQQEFMANLKKNEKAFFDAKKSAQEEADQKAFNARYGIPENERLTKNERDGIVNGTLYYGLSKKDEETAKKLEEEIDRIVSDPSSDQADIDALMKQRDDLKKRFRSRVRERADDETPLEEQFAKRTFVKDGITYQRDDKGGFTVLNKPENPSTAITLEQRAEDARKKYILSAVEKARKEYESPTEDIDTTERKPFDINDAIKTAGQTYDAVYGAQPSGTPIVVNPLDPLNPSAQTQSFMPTAQVHQPTTTSVQPAPSASDDPWRKRRIQGAQNPNAPVAPVQQQANAQPAPFSVPSEQQNPQDHQCPICKIPLVNGVCQKCGWPNNQQNNQTADDEPNEFVEANS